jgi:hypothetical protein
LFWSIRVRKRVFEVWSPLVFSLSYSSTSCTILSPHLSSLFRRIASVSEKLWNEKDVNSYSLFPSRLKSVQFLHHQQN